ncbi:MAG: acyl-CoA dehydrogenase family protein [Rhodospirillales bacterium]|nr:acyl-CoA dehydrogenase family protein [Rhodospirillales bacterium]
MAETSYLGWPFFEERHRDLAARLESWAQNELPKVVVSEKEEQEELAKSCRNLAQALGKAGFLAHCVAGPKGEVMDARSIAIGREILARHAGLADFVFAMQGLGTGPVSLFGSPAQQAHWLPKVTKGECLSAFALSEKEAGSDVASLATTAVRDGDHWVLNGGKTWISNAGVAGLYVVFARTGEAPGAKGLSAFIVEPTDPGFSVSEFIDVIAPHPLGSLLFKNCRIPADRLVGQTGQGFKIAMATLDIFRTTVGAAALGFARRALDEAVERANRRKLFGHTLGEFQITQDRLADSAVEIDASALLVYRSAWTKDVLKQRVTRESSMAKLFATEAAQRVIDRAVQGWGGLGVVKGVPVERLYREIRALRIYEGASEVQKLIIAGRVLSGEG